MTGRALLANYGKFLACLVLALVPAALWGVVLMVSLLDPPHARLPALWSGIIAVVTSALFATAIFGLALRSGRGTSMTMRLLTVMLVIAGLSPLALFMRVDMVASLIGLALVLSLLPISIYCGAREVTWTRIISTGSVAVAATLCGMLYVLWFDRKAMEGVLRVLLIALPTLGFLPFARMERRT